MTTKPSTTAGQELHDAGVVYSAHRPVDRSKAKTLKDLPPGWTRISMGDAGRWVGGGTPSKANPQFWTDGTIPWVSPKDMKCDFIADAQDHITEAAVARSATNLVAAGSVLIVVRSGILQHTLPVAVTKRQVALNQDLKAVMPREGLRSDFLALALKAFEQDILHTCTKTGTTVQSLELPVFLRYTIPLPPLPEQRRIVAEIEKQFTRMEAGVTALRRVQANLKRYRAAVLKAACEGRLVPIEAELHRQATSAAPPFESGAALLARILTERRRSWHGRGQYKEPAAPDTTKLPTMPDGWVWTNIGQVGHVGTGATPNRGKSEYYDGGAIPWVTSGRVNNPRIDSADQFVTPIALEQCNLTIYPPGTLLLAMYGEGKTRGMASELGIEATTNQALAAIQVPTTIRGFIKVVLWKNYDDVRKSASGGVQPNINLSIVREIPVPLPPLVEQIRIVAEVERRLSVVEGLEAVVATNLQRATRLRLSILRKAFTGALGAKVPGAKEVATEAPVALLAPGAPKEPRSPSEVKGVWRRPALANRQTSQNT